jgi:hypothetical protein
MSDKAEGGLDVKDITSTSFGYIIGFLLPGLLSLYGLAFWSSRVEKIMQPAINIGATLGPSVILLLAALAAGLIVSAIRCYVFEKFVCRNTQFEKDMFSRLGTGEKLTSFRAVVDEHYRYHQFHGGCFVGLAVAYFGWLWNTYPTLTWTWRAVSMVGFIVVEALMFVTAKDAYEKYIERGNTIVKGSGTEATGVASATATRVGAHR